MVRIVDTRPEHLGDILQKTILRSVNSILSRTSAKQRVNDSPRMRYMPYCC